ncbi:MAG: TlyA family RNA methyltransferase [Polyangiaceae bacterium]
MKPKKQRADLLLVERGLVDSRSRAQALIMAGQVFSGDRRVEKAGDKLAPDAELSVKEQPRFVSRGGDKLAHALDAFAPLGLSVADRVAVDVGASTGGFTDCLLQRGTTRVHAVDVGWGQLHPKLRDDPRVDCRERTNARHLTAADFPTPIDLVVVDASFIGIAKLLDAIASFLRPGGDLVALIKPQFEVGKEVAQKTRGVIRDEAAREIAITAALTSLEEAGFTIMARVDSTVRGPKGNLEHLVWARREHGSTKRCDN